MDPMESMSLSGGRIPAGFNAEEAGNMEDMEKQFAVATVKHLETYWNLLEAVPGSKQRLTKMDNEIYEHFKTEFPEWDSKAAINEDEMKSKTGKERWRKFLMAYEKKVDDYNFGTMLRNKPRAKYEEHTTLFVPRMQFLAIEIARNKEYLNDWIFEEAEAKREEARKAKKAEAEMAKSK